ncbi:Rho-related GTP-binding protein RhoF [Heterocephalus glaber]|uniref:Rho-related GTP-binding protein RhoF n=1 Tax=Heterocephalus glaber TaxID=10181 RepID=G5AWN6_HETGA|nr:Rho-related GTP-binding protein RhoF [Heterocephalus glaber]
MTAELWPGGAGQALLQAPACSTEGHLGQAAVGWNVDAGDLGRVSLPESGRGEACREGGGRIKRDYRPASKRPAPLGLRELRHYAPSVFEKYSASVTVGSKEVTLNLYDTAENVGCAPAPPHLLGSRTAGSVLWSLQARGLRTESPGQEDYDRLRPLSYQNTHLVLICYDVMNPISYDNVLIKWFPEVTHFCRGTPMVLIGCKTDLRKDKEQLRKLRAAQLEPITYNQGLSACQQIRAALYLECSAKFRENVEDVFREAAKVALSALKKAQRQKQRRLCVLL